MKPAIPCGLALFALILSGAIAEAIPGAREYDPDTGQFLSPDPFGLAAGMNRYGFCGNNPISIFDPDGRLGKNPMEGGITQVGTWLSPRIAGPHVLDLGDVGAEAAYFGLPHPDAGTSDILNLTPGIGMLKAFGEAITGSDLLTGESVDPFDRLASGGIQFAVMMPARPVGPLRPPALGASSAARHSAWAGDLNAINATVERLGQRALRQSGGNWRTSEMLFEGYLQGVQNRFARTGGPLSVQIQPAAIPGVGRVPAFRRFGDRVFATGGSRRLDAGVAGSDGKLVSGFDITLDPSKPNIVPYYQEAFGDIPIFDIRLP